MTNFKNILFISSIFMTISFSEEPEDPRTIEKDGTLYKINATSLNITPYYEDNAIQKDSKSMEQTVTLSKEDPKNCKISCLKSCCESKECDLILSMGALIPIGNDDFDPGTSISLQMPTDWNFNLLDKTWSVTGEINLSSLPGSDNKEDTSVIAGIALFNPSFDLPVDVSLGLGISKSDDLGGISGLGLVDAIYTLPFEKYDISIGFRYQKFVDISNADGLEIDFGLLDTFGFNLQCNKSF